MSIHAPRLFVTRAPRPWAVAGFLLALLLHACGGGSTATTTAGVGSGGSGLASGTVNGLGSIYVDGVEIEDARSLSVVENADGSSTPISMKLGYQVTVRRDASGEALRTTVEPTVVGRVDGISPATMQISVAGQWVAINTDAATGPLTLFGGGYLALGDVRVGDTVEVHAIALSAGSTTMRATRVDRNTAASALRVTGIVSRINAGEGSFALNGLTVLYAGAAVEPGALADGQRVTVWGGTTGAATTLQARRVRLERLLVGLTEGAPVQVGGHITAWQAASRSFEVQGLRVRAGDAGLTPAGAELSDGRYVRVQGLLSADGSVNARSVQVQHGDTGAQAGIRLAGTVGSLRSSGFFVVRDVPVDASAFDAGAPCAGRPLASGSFVQIVARAQSGTDVVKAESLSCSGILPSYGIQQVRGVGGAVAPESRGFALSTASGTTLQAVRWTDHTAFKGVTAAALAGADLIVNGYLENAQTLVAREIRVPGHSDADRFDPRLGDGEWRRYDEGFRART